jgi:hypothetical protein
MTKVTYNLIYVAGFVRESGVYYSQQQIRTGKF